MFNQAIKFNPIIRLNLFKINLRMKALLSALLMLASTIVLAQNELNPNHHSRNSLDPDLAPFYHGVASGDPLSDAVIIWTRITLNETNPVEVNWRMATDTSFNTVVANGSFTTDSTMDWTVKVDVTGLTENTWYYYDFEYNGTRSLMGRTRTAPSGNVDQLRFAVASCQSYENGYYHAYRDMVNRNDIDCVLHLGDYIYEYATGGLSAGVEGRTVEPENEIISLSDYRTRYSHYRLDPDLREAHRQYPFICVWDDHETANNSWRDGAENHTEGSEGSWIDRKAYGIQANMEWLPIRRPDENDFERQYRDFSFGNLADINMLDTRLYDRDEQGAGNENERSMLGFNQRQWLYQNLSNSNAKWKLLGQQVMMAPLALGGVILNDDQWDGYPAERDTLYDVILNNSIDNTVVLTGDIHTSWANDLPGDGYNGQTGANSLGVEFVVTSISTTSSPVPIPGEFIQGLLPHVKYVDLSQKGYLILDLTEDKAQSDWYYVSDITQPDFTSAWDAGFYANDGENHLNEASEPAQGGSYPPLAPGLNDGDVGIAEVSTVILSAYPNPFDRDFVVQFNLFQSQRVSVKLTDVSGKVIIERELGEQRSGLHYLEITTGNVASGMYILSLQTDSEVINRRMLKR